jgi:hypothetical protein
LRRISSPIEPAAKAGFYADAYVTAEAVTHKAFPLLPVAVFQALKKRPYEQSLWVAASAATFEGTEAGL